VLKYVTMYSRRMPNAKRPKYVAVDQPVLGTKIKMERLGSVPTSVISLIKRGSLTNSQLFTHSNVKVHESGHVLITSGKDLFIWEIQNPKQFYHFDVPLFDSEQPCLVTLVSPLKKVGDWGVLVVAPDGAYRYWESIQSPNSAFTHSKIPLTDPERYFSHLKSNSMKKGIVVLCSNDGKQLHLLTCGGDTAVAVEPIVTDDSAENDSQDGIFSRFWGSAQKKTQHEEMPVDSVLAVQFLHNFIYVLTEQKLIRYSIVTKELESQTSLLEDVTNSSGFSQDTTIWLVDISCQSYGTYDNVYVLAAYERNEVISYIVWPVRVQTSATDITYALDYYITCKLDGSQYDDLSEANIYSKTNGNAYVVLRNSLLAFYDDLQDQVEVPLAFNAVSAGIVQDQLYMLTEGGKLFRAVQDEALQVVQQRSDTINDSSQQSSTRSPQYQVTILLRKLYNHMHNQRVSNIEDIVSGQSIVEASRQIVDARPGSLYRWTTSTGTQEDDEEDIDRKALYAIVNDTNSKVSVLILDELLKKYRQHKALLNMLPISSDKNGYNLWRNILSHEEQKQIIGHGEMLKFAIGLREFQNSLVTEKKHLPLSSTDQHKDFDDKIRILSLAMLHICEKVRMQELVNPESFYTQVSKIYQIFDVLQDSEKKGEIRQHNDYFEYSPHKQNILIMLINSVFITFINSVRSYHKETMPAFYAENGELSLLDSALMTNHKRDLMSGNNILYQQFRSQIDIVQRALDTQIQARSEPVHVEKLLIDDLYALIDFYLEIIPQPQQYVEQRTILMSKMKKFSFDKTIRLAEKYEDFYTLIELLAQDPNSTKSKLKQQNLDYYMNKFRDYEFPLKVFQYYVTKGWHQAILNNQEWNKLYHSEIAQAIQNRENLAWIHAIAHQETDPEKYGRILLVNLERVAMNKNNNLRDKKVRLSMYKLANLSLSGTNIIQEDDIINNVNRSNVLLHMIRAQEALMNEFSLDILRHRWFNETKEKSILMPLTPDRIMSSVYNEILTGHIEKLVIHALDEEEKVQELEDFLYKRLALTLEVYNSWILNYDLWQEQQVSENPDHRHLFNIYHAALMASVQMRKLMDPDIDISEVELKSILKGSVFFKVAEKFIGKQAMLTEELVEALKNKVDSPVRDLLSFILPMWSLLEEEASNEELSEFENVTQDTEISILSNTGLDFGIEKEDITQNI
jgi:hypothetical protein